MMWLKEKIVFAKQIQVLKYIYFNYFCKKIVRKGSGKIIPYKNAIIDLEENSKIYIGNRDIEIGVNKLKGSEAETYLRLRSGALWMAEGGAQISFGSTIEILQKASVKSGYFTMSSFGTIIAQKSIVLGDDVMMARNVIIFDSDFHYFEYLQKTNEGAQEVVIGNHVWLTANVTVLKGVKIGDGSIIAANTVVTKDVGEAVLVGNEKKMTVLSDSVIWKR